jgi:hypothetical protein
MSVPPSSPFGPAADQREPSISFGPLEDVPIVPPAEEISWAELGRRRSQRNDGTHAWYMPVYFEQADPEVALDDMVCGPDNMIGIGPMCCFWCRIEYPRDGSGPTIAATWCPGRPAEKAEVDGV